MAIFGNNLKNVNQIPSAPSTRIFHKRIQSVKTEEKKTSNQSFEILKNDVKNNLKITFNVENQLIKLRDTAKDEKNWNKSYKY